MKPKTWTHPKFIMLQRRLNVGPAIAAGILEGIWHLAATFDDEFGRIGFAPDELVAWLGLDLALGPDSAGILAADLVAALVTTGWLDEDEQGLRVHDWGDHRPAYVNDRIRMRTVRKQFGTVQNNRKASPPSASDSASDSDCIPRSRSESAHAREDTPSHADQRNGCKARKSRKDSGRTPIRTAVTVDAIADQAAAIFDACHYRGDNGGNLWGVAALLETGIGDLTEAEVYSAARGASLNGKDKPAHFYQCLEESIARRGENLKALLRRVNIMPAWPQTRKAAGGET